MTRKDYVLISDALAAAKPEPHKEAEEAGEIATLAEEVAWRNCCLYVANALDHDSPRFDKDRFLKACGMEG